MNTRTRGRDRLISASSLFRQGGRLDEQVPSKLALERGQLPLGYPGPFAGLLVLVALVRLDVPGEDVRLPRLGHVESREQGADALVAIRVGDRAAGLRL